MNARREPRFGALALFFALAVSSCGKGDAGHVAPPPISPPATTLDAGAARVQPRRAAPVDDPSAAERLSRVLVESTASGNDDAVIEALARAGITVLDDDGETPMQALAGSPSPFVFARSEAAAFARELASGGGRSGAQFDTFSSAGSAVSLSDFIVAYVRAADTFGARLSRLFLSGQELSDPKNVRFAGIVGVVFLADVFPRLFWVDSHNKPIFSSSAAIRAPCAMVDTILSPVRAVFSGALRENVSTAMGAAMVRDVATARAIPEETVRAAWLDALPSLRILTAVVHFGALFESWSLRIVGPTTPVHYRVAGIAAPDTTVRVSVLRGSLQPAWLTDCALSRGAAISAADVLDAPVNWRAGDGFRSHASFVGATTGQIDDAGASVASFRLNEESEAVHAAGAMKSASVVLACDIERAPFSSLGTTIARLLGDATARTVTSAYSADVFDRLAQLVAPPAIAAVRLTVTYHE